MKGVKLLRLIIPILILGGLGYTYYSSHQNQGQTLYYGEVELDSYDAYALVSGVIDQVNVKEGDLVEGHEVLVTLDMEKALLQQQKALIGTDISEENVVKSQAPADDEALNIQRNTIAQLMSQKQGIAASVQSTRQLYQQSRITGDSLKAAYDLESQSFANTQALYENGAVTKNSLDQAQLKLTQSQNSYEAALVQNSKLLSDIRSLESQMAALDSQILSAEEQLKSLEGGYGESDRIITDLTEDIAHLDAALAQKTIDDHSIVTLQKGRVESVNYTVGEFVVAGTPVISLYNPEKPIVKLYVHEKDLFLLEQGMAMTFELTAVEGVEIIGEIIHIASEAMFTPVNIVVEEDRERLVYEIEVALTTEVNLKAGMLLATDFGELEAK